MYKLTYVLQNTNPKYKYTYSYKKLRKISTGYLTKNFNTIL